MCLRTLSSSASLPSRASRSTAAAVNCFETDPTSKIVSTAIGTSCSRSAMPYAARTAGWPFTSAPTAHPGVLVVNRENSVSTRGWIEAPGPWAAVWPPRNAALAMTMRLTERRLRMVRILPSGGNDGAGDSASVFFFRPIGRQHLQVHGSTEAAVVNLPFRHTGKNELIAICGRNIQTQLRPFTGSSRWRRGRKPPFDEIALVTGGSEGIDQVRADGIAARANAGSDGGDYIRGMSAVLTLHRVERSDCRAGSGAAPAGMNGRHRPGHRIGHQQRHAVGGANCNRDVGRVRDERVGLRPVPGTLSGVDDRNGRTVHLGQFRHVLDAERGRQPRVARRRGEPQLPCREEVRRQTVERTASKGGAPRRFGPVEGVRNLWEGQDRKSTRLNSSHGYISYAVLC